MSRVKGWAAGLAAVSLVLTASALAQETTSFSYDGLGRLKTSAVTGGPNDTRKTGSCFDAAGNRMRYDVSTTTPAACPSPSPTPTAAS